ncbi:MAG: hypothetical protein Q8M11_18880 [Sulfuritalea sp.]|nr:hypothetical protein [Sulfuritalea sp.]MDP1983413.1 hypothetical protein [Sulfuritalea sp.]
MPRLSKRYHLLALACYLAIPVVLIAGVALASLIDPEMARSHADYARDYRLLDMVRQGALVDTAGVALLLWTATCYLLLKARQRSLNWLSLAAAGPFGFVVMAMLKDRAPAPDDLYQQFIGKLKAWWRVPLEIGVLVAVCLLAYLCVATLRELMIGYQSFARGIPAATIVAEQNASGGMWAFGEALEELYLVVLIYLLWPIAFNLVGRLLIPRSGPAHQAPGRSGT